MLARLDNDSRSLQKHSPILLLSFFHDGESKAIEDYEKEAGETGQG